MSTTNETEKINFRIAQLNFMLHQNLISKKFNVDWAFDQMDNINCKVIHTDYFRLYCKHWIGCTVLHFAAMQGDFDALRTLLDCGADMTVKNNQNSTALHLIVENIENHGYIYYPIIDAYTLDDPLLYLFLSAHLKSSNFENPLNDCGLSHFHITCAANNVELVNWFLRSGICINHAVNADSSLYPGFTPLHFAAKYCAYKVTEVLLSHGADVHIKDTRGMTPLLLALENQLKIISEGANLDEKVRDKNEKILGLLLEKESSDDMIICKDWGLSQLHVACTLKDSKISESLLKKVANINHAVNMDSTLWPGYNALHFAALCNIDTVKLLMKNGADIGMKDVQGTTPLDICAEKYGADNTYTILSLNPVYKNILLTNGKTNLTDLVFAMSDPKKNKKLLKKLGKKFSIGDSPLWPGYSPMHLAVLFSEEMNMQILENLCKHSKMFSAQDIHGRSPLHLAFRLDKQPALDLLFKHLESRSKLVDLVDEDGLSYLHIACARNRTKLLIKLLGTETNINAVYKGKSLSSPAISPGSTALHFAVVNKSTEAAEELIKHGADVYAKDANDMTAIHLLQSDFQHKLADILLTTPSLRDSVANGTGLSHLHIACLQGTSNAVEILLNNGADVNATISAVANQFPLLKKYAGHSPLLLAEENNHVEVAELLLQRGADAFVKDTDDTPLIYSVLEVLSLDTFSVFVDHLRKSEELQTRVEVEIGMTRLHVACLAAEIELVERLIGEGADVDARIRVDSPMLKGCTALHVVMHVTTEYHDAVIDSIIKLLVEAGADVTLQDAGYGGTAIHLACRDFFFKDLHKDALVEADNIEYARLKNLLKAQRDFSVNPVNFEGISHFHVGCYVCNASIVDKFLSHGNVDVNQPVDYFHNSVPGYTALHLAAANAIECKTVSEQLATVDLLLENGADVRAQNAFGNTPLHEAALLRSFDVFERLVRSGADVEARNFRGNTVLNHFIESMDADSCRNAAAEKIRVLLRCGCQFNTFNVLTDKGCAGLAVHKLPYADMQNLLSAVVVNFKQKMEMDDSGRKLIHNIVSVDSPAISANEYAELIEKLSRTKCDVDKQDSLGRTALHMAVKFHNYKAISGLFMVGADVNITDKNNQSALDYFVDHCKLCSPEIAEVLGEEGCLHLLSLEDLSIHVKKLQLCGLDVNEESTKLVCADTENFENRWTEFIKELETIKNTTIGSHSLTLYEFLSENGAVTDYPTMSEMKRNDINEYFSSRGTQALRERFPEIAGILQLQYRKTRARPQLLELAKNAMEILMGFRMPEVCSYFILVPLKNSELKNLIASVTV